MGKTKSLAEKVKEAEKAVSSVSNPELQKIAFEQVLNHLLGPDSKAEIKSIEKPASKESKNSSKEVKTKAPKSASTGPKAWLLQLVERGFFASQKSTGDIRDELDKLGHPVDAADLTRPLKSLVEIDKVLDRTKRIKSGGKSKEVVWFIVEK
jgi:hypothetical protein